MLKDSLELIGACAVVVAVMVLAVFATDFIAGNPVARQRTVVALIVLLSTAVLAWVLRELRALRPRLPDDDEIQAKAASLQRSSAVEHLRSAPLGIVLSGGGAKGAYEVGVWQAFHDLGIRRYEAFAGTSVGALNATLMAQGGLEVATKIWHDMSFATVMRVTPLRLLAALLLRLCISPKWIIGQLLSIDRVSRYGYYLQRTGPAGALGNTLTVFLSAQLAGLTVAARAAGYSPWQALGLVAQIVAALSVLILAWWQLRRVHAAAARGLALSSNSPLKQLASHVLATDLIRRTAVFVTVAQEQFMFLPPSVARPLGDFPPPDTPQYAIRYGPRYQRLSACPTDEELRRYVVQSAGLPEVFPRVVLDDKESIDGGVVDNTPILPLLQHTSVEHLIVVYLARGAAAPWRREVERIRNLGRQLGLLNVGEHDARQIIRQTRDESKQWVPLIDWQPPAVRRALTITPSRHLGGLVTGTMNFTAGKARRLMKLGYWDALVALESNHWQPIDATRWASLEPHKDLRQ